MDVWVTDRVLTEGIYKVENAERHPTLSSTVLVQPDDYGFRRPIRFPYWYFEHKHAVRHANEIQRKRINYLKKELARVKKLFFDVVAPARRPGRPKKSKQYQEMPVANLEEREVKCII